MVLRMSSGIAPVRSDVSDSKTRHTQLSKREVTFAVALNKDNKPQERAIVWCCGAAVRGLSKDAKPTD